MGADSVYFYYGVRRSIPLDDEGQIARLEDGRALFPSLRQDMKHDPYSIAEMQ
jgi:hypothetical protein